jgi:hypothetical protein
MELIDLENELIPTYWAVIVKQDNRVLWVHPDGDGFKLEDHKIGMAVFMGRREVTRFIENMERDNTTKKFIAIQLRAS